MKIKSHIACLWIGCFFLFNSSFAQEKLTLSEAIEFALENKAEAKKAKLEIINSEHVIEETRSAALPQVNFDGALNYNPLIQKSAIPAEIFGGEPGEFMMVEFGQKWQGQGAVAVSQQLFNQTVFTGLKAAKTTREFYQINNTLTEEELIEKVANSYYEVYQAQLRLETLENNLENTNKTKKIIEGMYESGLAKKIDLDRVKVSVSNLEAQKQQLVNALELQENALKFVIGMNISTKIEMPEETFEIQYKDYGGVDGFNSRTEVKMLDKQQELLELNRQAIVSEYYPSLMLTGNFGYLGFGNTFPLFFKDKGVQWSNFGGVGLSLSIPIFNGNATRARVRQADVELKMNEIDKEDALLALSMADENAKAQIRNSLLTVQSNRENVVLAKEVMEDTQNNYRLGIATLTEMLEAETAYADAQNNLNTSLLDYKVAEIQVLKSKGELKSLLIN